MHLARRKQVIALRSLEKSRPDALDPALARHRSHRVNHGPITFAEDRHMQTQTIGSHEGAGARLSSRSEALGAAILAALLGAFLIWGVGFSHINVLHNAAHDTRHSTGFPCH
jgi:cobalt transporter subunit CbtB